MKLLTASLFSVALCAGAWAQTNDAKSAESTAEAKPAAKAAASDKAKPAAEAKPADKAKPAAEAGKTAVEDVVDAAFAEPAEKEQKPEPSKDGLDSLAKRAGYAFGLNIGTNIKAQQIELDMTSMIQGLKDGISGDEPKMDQQAVQMAMIELQQYVQKQQMERAQVQGGKNTAEGTAFLEKNKTAEGVKTTESGLQYKVIEAGKGESPKPTDVVTVHYVGKLIDGTEFDSSYKRNQPATFPVNGVIPGWTEALQLMKPGAKFKLFIPSDLAYGPQGAGDVIAPNATLIFDVELVSIQAGGEAGVPAGHSADDGHNH